MTDKAPKGTDRRVHIVDHRPRRGAALHESHKPVPTGKRPPVTLPVVTLATATLDRADAFFGHQWEMLLKGRDA